MTDKETNEYIDRLLDLFKESETVDHEAVKNFGLSNRLLLNKSQPSLILTKMNRLDIVKSFGSQLDQTWTLTEFGQRVLRHGSWTKYMYHKEDLIVEQINSSISANRWQKWILIGTFALSGASAFISWLGYNDSKERQGQREELIEILKQQYEERLQLKTEIVTPTKIDSLPK